MAAEAIVVNTGRDKLIAYSLNSNESTQVDKYYLKEFILLTGITEDPVVERVWDETGLGQDLFPYMLVGDISGSPTDGRFNISQRIADGINKRTELQLDVPTTFSTLGATIDGVAILYYTESSEVGLFAYGIVTAGGQNKVAGTDLTITVKIQF